MWLSAPTAAVSPPAVECSRTPSSRAVASIWDAATGAEILTLAGPPGGVQCVAFSPDGTRLALTGMKSVELWDLGMRQRARTFSGHTDLVNGVAFSPDGTRLASAGYDDTVRIWDAGTGASVLVLRGATGKFMGVTFSPDGRSVAAAGEDHGVKLWDATTGEERGTFRGHATWVMDVAFSPDGTRLASAGTDGMKVWDVQKGRPAIYHQETADGKRGQVQGVALGPDGRLLAVMARDVVGAMVWDTTTGARVLSIADQRGMGGVALSDDGRRLALANRGPTITLLDARTGREVFAINGHDGPVTCVAFSPGGRTLASGGWDRCVRLWDGATGKEVLVLRGALFEATGVPPFEVTGVGFSRDGRRLAASARGDVSIWETTTGKQVFSRRSRDAINDVALRPDGRQVAWATGVVEEMNRAGEVKVCDVENEGAIRTLRGHTAPVMAVAYSPDGTRLVSASRDFTAKVWDVASGTEVIALRGHTGSVTCLAFSADGRFLASGANDFTARLWDARPLSPEQTDLSGGMPHP